MSDRASRVILGVEALIICLPLTILFVVAVLPSSFYFLPRSEDAQDYAMASASLIILATLVCAWLLVLSFLLRGSNALRRLSLYWWAPPFLSAVLAFAAIVYLWLETEPQPSWIYMFGWGIPLVVPLGHLCGERWWRSSANPPLNTDARQETPRAG
jgi:hypothetical protein